MRFTYADYQNLICLLREKEYSICSYHNWNNTSRCAILRHDVDIDLNKAVRLAEFEAQLEVKSTYFILLTSNFYNPASKTCLNQIRTIQSMGHEIGLHFDERVYPDKGTEETIKHILKERDILSSILSVPVTTVSMHRPSQATLDANLEIAGMVNSYGRIFFRQFKYVSDSRCRWREPVLDIVESGSYDKLHILTHAFWYDESEKDVADTVKSFLNSAYKVRYEQMKENITDLDEILMDH